MSDRSLALQGPGRLDGLDLARLFAFAGMVVVNFKAVLGVEGGQDILSQLSTALEGRAAATFVVLAGIGLGLAAQKSLTRTRQTTLKRVVFLFAIGLLNSLIFEPDILHYYAIYFLFRLLFLQFGLPALVLVAFAMNFVATAMLLLLDYDAGWEWDSLTYTDFWTFSGFIRNLFFNGWHPVFPWLTFLVVGLILARLQLSKSRTQLSLIGFGLLLVLATETASAFFANTLSQVDAELVALVGTAPVPPTIFYILAGCGVAIAGVGLCLFLAQTFPDAYVFRILMLAGRQTLTLYIAHILIGMGILEALNLIENGTVEQALLAAFFFVVTSLVYTKIWSKSFRQGPIETLMRKLTG